MVFFSIKGIKLSDMDTDQTTPEDFSLSEGGPFHRALVKTKLINHPGKLRLIGLFIAWVPLLIITSINGTAFYGTEMPFLKDAAIQGRLLLAIPLLIIMRHTIDTKVNAVIHYIADALMSPEERQIIVSTAIYRAKRLTNSALTEIILVIIVILYSISLVKSNTFGELQGGTTSWMAVFHAGNQELTFAGRWACFHFHSHFSVSFLPLVVEVFRVDTSSFQIVQIQDAVEAHPCRQSRWIGNHYAGTTQLQYVICCSGPGGIRGVDRAADERSGFL